MSLRLNSTMDAFIDKMTRNEKIMTLMNLPTILDTDNEDIKKKKKTLIIDKVITKTAQNPFELNKDFPEIKIGNIRYKGYGKKIRMAVSLAQSIKMNSYVFGSCNLLAVNVKTDTVFGDCHGQVNPFVAVGSQ